MFSSMFKKKSVASEEGEAIAVDDEDIDAQWTKANKKYEDSKVRDKIDKKNWRLFAFISLLIAAVSVTGNVVQGTQSKLVPYLVEVDQLGRTLAVRSLDSNDIIINRKGIVYRDMMDMIENVRTVSTDPGVNRKNMDRVYSHITGEAKGYVFEFYDKHKPNEIGAKQVIEVHIRAAFPTSKDTWQVEWAEDTISLGGTLISSENWKANLTYDINPSSDIQKINKNPEGFMVNALSWTRVI